MSDETNDKDGSSNTPTRDYEVGYRKPPTHTRFKPGESGNPRGRPRGTKNLKTDLSEELGEKIEIREGDRSRKVSKQRALIKSQTNKAIKGDTRAAAFLGSLMMRLLDTGEGAPETEDELFDDELQILKAFEERTRSAREPRTSDGSDATVADEDEPETP